MELALFLSLYLYLSFSLSLSLSLTDLGLGSTAELKEAVVRAGDRLKEIGHCVRAHTVVLDAGERLRVIDKGKKERRT